MPQKCLVTSFRVYWPKMLNTTSKMAAATVIRALRSISFYFRLPQRNLNDAEDELKPIFTKFEFLIWSFYYFYTGDFTPLQFILSLVIYPPLPKTFIDP